MELPETETLAAGSDYTIQPPSELQVSDEQGTWYFIGWYDKVGVPYGGTISAIDADTTLYGRWDFQATPEEPEPDPGDGRFMVIKEPDQTSVTVGDPITWTITIASMTDETLTLDVTDKLEGVTLTDEEGNTVTNPVIVEGWTYATLYASYQTSLDDVDQKIVNTVVVTDTVHPEDPPGGGPGGPRGGEALCHHHHAGGHCDLHRRNRIQRCAGRCGRFCRQHGEQGLPEPGLSHRSARLCGSVAHQPWRGPDAGCKPGGLPELLLL